MRSAAKRAALLAAAVEVPLASAAGSVPRGSAVSSFAFADAEKAAEAIAHKRAAGRAEEGDDLEMMVPRGGGGECEHDWDCGWFDPSITAEDRRDLPSGNGARCLVGRCVCADQFENKFGCDRCTLELHPKFSYSDEGMEITTVVRDFLNRNVNLCDVPVGGASCHVGKCARDEDNRTIECPGDFECDAAGSGSGICVGADDTIGTCVCGRGYFCRDCSLHEVDLREGARCDSYTSGGALCEGDTDCGPAVAGYCAQAQFHTGSKDDTIFDLIANRIDRVGSLDHPYCACERGWTCRRCEQRVHDLETGDASCGCDEPVVEPNGGTFNKTVEVDLTASPWDSALECEVYFKAQRVEYLPGAPAPRNLSDIEDLAGFLTEKGDMVRRRDDGTESMGVLNYDPDLADAIGWDEKGRRRPQHFHVYAVTVPKANTSWVMARSRVVRSRVIVLLAAAERMRPHLAAACLAVIGWLRAVQ